MERVPVQCTPLEGIECYSPDLGCWTTNPTTNSTARSFTREGQPCIRHSDKSFLHVLLCSIFVGFLGVDRFVIGHVGIGVAKLLTLGGLGVWWIIDLLMLVAGVLHPDAGWSHSF